MKFSILIGIFLLFLNQSAIGAQLGRLQVVAQNVLRHPSIMPVRTFQKNTKEIIIENYAKILLKRDAIQRTIAAESSQMIKEKGFLFYLSTKATADEQHRRIQSEWRNDVFQEIKKDIPTCPNMRLRVGIVITQGIVHLLFRLSEMKHGKFDYGWNKWYAENENEIKSTIKESTFLNNKFSQTYNYSRTYTPHNYSYEDFFERLNKGYEGGSEKKGSSYSSNYSHSTYSYKQQTLEEITLAIKANPVTFFEKFESSDACIKHIRRASGADSDAIENFLKKCTKDTTLLKKVHPDGGGTAQAFRVFNELRKKI